MTVFVKARGRVVVSLGSFEKDLAKIVQSAFVGERCCSLNMTSNVSLHEKFESVIVLLKADIVALSLLFFKRDFLNLCFSAKLLMKRFEYTDNLPPRHLDK